MLTLLQYTVGLSPNLKYNLIHSFFTCGFIFFTGAFLCNTELYLFGAFMCGYATSEVQAIYKDYEMAKLLQLLDGSTITYKKNNG